MADRSNDRDYNRGQNEDQWRRNRDEQSPWGSQESDQIENRGRLADRNARPSGMWDDDRPYRDRGWRETERDLTTRHNRTEYSSGPDSYLHEGDRRYQGQDSIAYRPGYLQQGGEMGHFGAQEDTTGFSPTPRRDLTPHNYQSNQANREDRGSERSHLGNYGRNQSSNEDYGQAGDVGLAGRPDRDYGTLSRYDRPITSRIDNPGWQQTPEEQTRGQNWGQSRGQGQWDTDRQRETERSSRLRVRDIMTRDVSSVTRDSTVREAAELMKDEDCGSLPVAENGRVIGVVTDRDIIIRGLAQNPNVISLKVSDIMTSELVTCQPNDRAIDALHKMSQAKVRRLPVVDNGNRLRGIVSFGDIAVELEHDEELSRAMKNISQPNW